MHAHTTHVYAHTPHEQRSHTHARVYHCSHYNRNGHLVKFCYDRLSSLNFACKNIWVSNGTNCWPKGPSLYF